MPVVTFDTPPIATTDHTDETWAVRAARRRELEIAEADQAATGAAFNSSL